MTVRTRRPARWLPIGVVLIALLAGTSIQTAAEEQPGADGAMLDLGAARVDPERRWTVLAYMDADNDLEGALLEDVNEMEQALPEQGVDVIALVDRAKGYDPTDGDWTDTRVYRLRPDADERALGSELLANLGERNCADGDLLAGFITQALRAFPAEHHALVLSDHGSGWTGSTSDYDAPGKPNDYGVMDTATLARALTKGLADAGVAKLDILCFDMCLMGQIELAVEVAPAARLMVASEALVPGQGFPYERILGELATPRSAAEIAVHMVKSFGEHYDGFGLKDATASVLDLERLPAVLDALDALSQKLEPTAATLWPTYSRSLFFAESYMGRDDFRKGKDAMASIDLRDFVDRTAARLDAFPAGPEATRLQEALDACVLHAYQGPERRLSHGLAVYAPVRGDMVNDAYAKTRFAKQSHWPRLLRAIHAVQARELAPPRISGVRLLGPTGQPVQVVSALGGTHLEFTVTGKNILWTTAAQVMPTALPDTYAVTYRTFIVDPRYDDRRAAAASELADLVMPEYADGANVLQREVGGLGFQVTDESRLHACTVDLSDPAAVTTARVPAIYDHPDDGQFLVDLSFDTQRGRVASVTAWVEQPDGGRTAKRLDPREDAKLTFLYNTVTSGGEIGVLPTTTTKWGAGPELVPVLTQPGVYTMVLEAESIAGKSAVELFQYQEQPGAELVRLVEQSKGIRDADLLGSWRMATGVLEEGRTELSWLPTGILLEFETWDGADENEVYYRMTKAGETDLPSGFAVLDTRGVPCISYYGRGERGGTVRTDFHLVFRQTQDGETSYLLKDLALGAVYRLSRPEAAPSLAGTWTNAEQGIEVVLQGERYTFSVGGEVQDAGRYEVSEDAIVTHSDGGGDETLRYVLDGDRLTIVDEDGTRMELTRAP